MNSNEVKVIMPKDEYDRLLEVEKELHLLIEGKAKAVIYLDRAAVVLKRMVVLEESDTVSVLSKELEFSREESARLLKKLNEKTPNPTPSKKWWQ